MESQLSLEKKFIPLAIFVQFLHSLKLEAEIGPKMSTVVSRRVKYQKNFILKMLDIILFVNAMNLSSFRNEFFKNRFEI